MADVRHTWACCNIGFSCDACATDSPRGPVAGELEVGANPYGRLWQLQGLGGRAFPRLWMGLWRPLGGKLGQRSGIVLLASTDGVELRIGLAAGALSGKSFMRRKFALEGIRARQT